MSTFRNPGCYACCFGEHEEASPWEPLHVEHGFATGDSTVAALPGEPLQVVVDGQSRKAADVLATIARSLEVVASHRTAALGDILIVLSPMRSRTVSGDGWSNADAGGAAGPFTALIPGWSFADSPARLVLKKIHRPA
jgi:hypothetical protein